jgi:hypothetical protein
VEESVIDMGGGGVGGDLPATMVVRVRWATWDMLARASPRKPKVWMLERSS